MWNGLRFLRVARTSTEVHQVLLAFDGLCRADRSGTGWVLSGREKAGDGWTALAAASWTLSPAYSALDAELLAAASAVSFLEGWLGGHADQEGLSRPCGRLLSL